jgi:alpha-galactosidase
MQGSLGVGVNLDKWTPDDFAVAKHMIVAYKQVRETVQHGSLYRLVSPQHNSEYSATEFVSLDKQQAVLFTFLHSSQKGYPSPRVYLRGLDSTRQYHLRFIHSAKALDAPDVASGTYWMNHGIEVLLQGDFQAAGVVLEAAAH